jgi:hypothetical protein
MLPERLTARISTVFHYNLIIYLLRIERTQSIPIIYDNKNTKPCLLLNKEYLHVYKHNVEGNT